MHRATDLVEQLLADLECADTVWFIRVNPTTLDMITVGGAFTHRARRAIARRGSLSDAFLATGKDTMIVRDVWALDLPVESRMTLLASRAQSNILAAIRVRGEPWGVLSATSSSAECPFTEHHAELMRRAAEAVAVRLEELSLTVADVP